MLFLALLAPTITLIVPGAPPEQVLAEVSRQTGEHYAAAKDVRDDILALQVSAMSADEFRQRIARVTSAVWRRPQKGHWILERPLSMTREQEAGEERERVRRVRALIEERYQSLPSWSTGHIASLLVGSAAASDDMHASDGARQQVGLARYMELRRENPAGRAMRRLMHSLSDAELQSVKPGDRAVYSTSPNSMQRSLGPVGQEALRLFNEENLSWTSQIRADRILSSPDRYSDPRYGPKNYQPATKLLLSTRISTGAFSVVLMALDVHGWVVGQTMDYYPYQNSFAPETKGIKEATLPANEEAHEAMIAAFAWNAGRTSWAGLSRDPLWRKWSAKFFAPDRNDPVSWWAGPRLIDLALSQRLQLVACVPDYATDFVPPDLMASPNEAASFARAVQAQWRVSMSTDERCLEVMPALPVQARKDRLNRAALTAFVKAVKETGANLENVSAYVLAQPSLTALLQLDRLYVASGLDAQGELTPREQFTFFNIPMLRLYGSLSRQQRNVLWNAGSLSLRELSSESKAALHRLAYGWNYRMPSLLDVQLPAQPDAEIVLDHALQEPTEALPNGVPASTMLVGRASNDPILVGGREFGEVVTREVLSSKELGPMFGDVPAGKEGDTYAFYELAEGRCLALDIQFAPGIRLPWTFAEVVLHPERRVSNFKALPESMRERVVRLAEEHRAKQQEGRARAIPPQ